MKKIKSIVALILMVVLAIGSLSGCGGSSSSNSSSASAGSVSTAQADSGSSKDKVVIKAGLTANVGSPEYIYYMKFVEELEKLMPGYFDVQVFDSGTLGAERELITAVSMGTLESTLVSDAAINMVDSLPMAEIGNVPFLIKSTDAMFEVLDRFLGDKLKEEYAKRGFELASFGLFGSVELGNSKHEIKTPEDLKNLKIRVWEAEGPFRWLENAGAQPTVMGFGEVYTALQQKTIDGVLTSESNFNVQGFREVCNYITAFGIFTNYRTLVFSKSWFDGLEPEAQEAIRQASKAAQDYCKEEQASNERSKQLEMLEEAGCTVTYYTDEERQAFVDQCKDIWPEFREMIGPEIFDQVEEAMYGN